MVRIDLESSVPLEEQIRQQIRRAIARGDVRRGDTLPSVRQLAGDLGIHWNTVARAYRRLRDEGLLVVGRGRGVTVREMPRPLDAVDPDTRSRVEKRVREAIVEARLSGMTLGSLRDLVLNELNSWKEMGKGG
jgi:DNA-binding transcriptional regulator YhcF (GntR family)